MRLSQRTRSIYLLTALLLFAFFYFLHDLDALGLWVDEGWTVSATNEVSLVDVTKWVAEDVHPPLYFYLVYGWRQFTGDTVFEFRYLTVLTIVLSTAVVYRLGKSLFSEHAGQISALLYILHDLVWVLGREARQYPLLQLLAALTVWQYWRFWHHPTRQRGLWFGLSGSALLWTNYWGGFMLLTLAIHALITRRNQLKPYILSFGGIGLSFSLWLPTLYTQLTEGIPDGLGHALPATPDGYESLLFQLVGIPEIFWLILALVGVFAIWQWQTPREWFSSVSILLGLIIGLTVGLTLFINYEYPILSFRTLSIVIPFILVLIAHTLSRFRPAEQFVLVSILVVHSLATQSAEPPLHLPWADVADYVVAHATHDDEIVIEVRYDVYALRYYLEQNDPNQPYLMTEVDRVNYRNNQQTDFKEILEDLLVDVDGIWVTKHNSPVYDIRPRLEEVGFINTANIIWGPSSDWFIELWRFDRPPSEILSTFGAEMQIGRIKSEVRQDELTVNILWSPPVNPSQNYVVSVFLLDEVGFLKTQHDSQPLEWTSSTTTWEANNWYFDSHILPITDLPAGAYQLGVKVYYFAETGAIQVMPLDDCADNCELWLAEQIIIE